MKYKNFENYKEKGLILNIKNTRQPDCLTCGPTSLKMLADYVFKNNNITVKELAVACGTCIETGTIDTGIISGLKHLNISDYEQMLNVVKDDETGKKYLNNALENKNLIILRTLIHGMKHWLLIIGKVDDEYFISDPAGGEYVVDINYILNIWRPRNYDGFQVFLNKINNEK